MITIYIGTHKAENMLNGLIVNIPKATARGLNRFSASMAVKLRKASLRHKFSGYMSSERGIHSVRLEDGAYAIKAPYYLTFIEEGTRPHYIPRTGKTERWAARHGMSFWAMRKSIATRSKEERAYPFVNAVMQSSVKKLIGRIVEKELNNTIRSKGRM